MSELNIAMVHHHLRGGGVTRIIEHSVRSLQGKNVRMCIITGEKPAEQVKLSGAPVGVVKGLSYGMENPSKPAHVLFDEMQVLARKLLGKTPDVWHIHNHSLGKNRAFTKSIINLAKEKARLVLHIHDFAEDNRPQNFKHLIGEKNDGLIETIYPIAPQIRYIVLNGRDGKYMKEAGVPPSMLTVLPNPVRLEGGKQMPRKKTAVKGNKNLWVYPTRAIPRKNIGELLLLAALSGREHQYALTLAPKNIAYKRYYEGWKHFAANYKLPVTFEAGKEWGIEFEALLAASTGLVTTSITEGFGLVFLESWLIDKPLFGRNIKAITADFENNGLDLSKLYSGIEIPLDWMDRKKLTERLKQHISRMYSTYGQELTPYTLEEWLDVLKQGNNIDFGVLNSEFQQEIIQKVIQNGIQAEDLHLKIPSLTAYSKETLKKNKTIVQEKYSLENYGENLLTLYQQLAGVTSEKPEFISPKKLLSKFLNPYNVSLLRS